MTSAQRFELKIMAVWLAIAIISCIALGWMTARRVVTWGDLWRALRGRCVRCHWPRSKCACAVLKRRR